jgi:hypothetical protein
MTEESGCPNAHTWYTPRLNGQDQYFSSLEGETLTSCWLLQVRYGPHGYLGVSTGCEFIYWGRLQGQFVNNLVHIPRDGLQNERGAIPLDVTIELINRLARAEVQNMEAGSFVSPKCLLRSSHNCLT